MLNTLTTLSLLSFLNGAPMVEPTTPETTYIATSAASESVFGELNEANEKLIFLIKDDSNVLLNVPFVHQKNDLKDTPDEWAGGSACGPSAITMALKFNDESVSLYGVVNTLPNDVYVKGKMFYNLAKGPELFGYRSNLIDINTEQIFNILNEGNPILMNVQNYDGITGHEIVVVGMKNYDPVAKTAESLIAHDPFRESYREFKYINETTLKQPEGWILPIGHTKPFYIVKQSLVAEIPTS